jgi:periplasmic copper chaperone A
MVTIGIHFKIAAAVLVLGLGAPVFAQDAGSRLGNLVVTNAWSPATPPTASVGVVYFSISNQGSKADRLMAVSSGVARAVELHESHIVKGVVEMRPVVAVDCPPGVTVKSEPGALHVMLMGLTRPLVTGTVFALTLQFRDAGALTVQVPVEAYR